MIPFASQRGLGQDLATHLLNEHDNEVMELAEIRGAIAMDLHGAFAEWEAQAHALTRCENYLYSLSINPDPQQEPLTRDEYQDYIQRAEERLGLSEQPRAVIFHSKHGREHCHVVWSRIDADNEKAVQLAFDRDKLMMVTREFAHDHGLTLPAGYYKDGKGGRGEQGDQLSLYEMHQKRTTGFTKEEHQEFVTDAWRSSDSPKAFVQALSEKGYLLATGKRPFVLVDFYGDTHALPKLIADKSVRTKDIRTFLERDYAPESLPSVDQAKDLIAKHRSDINSHAKVEQYNDELAELKHNQEQRRSKFENKEPALKQKHHNDRLALATKQKAERDELRTAHLIKAKHINEERARNSPGKLGKAFGKISAYSKLKKALQKYNDRKRTKLFLKNKAQLKQAQSDERLALARKQEMQSLDFQRKLRALDKLEKREFRSFEEAMNREGRIQSRGGRDEMPSLVLGKDDEKQSKEQGSLKVRRYGRKRKNSRDNDRGR
jgi:hypothetical protein